MRKAVPILLLVALMPCFFVLYKVSYAIRPGMTRADLLTVFREEGGISTRTQRTYVYRHWPPFKGWRFIKVDVDFEAIGPKNGFFEPPTDKIIKVSWPYLEWGVYD